MLRAEFPSGSESLITVTKEHEHVWVLEMHNGADNRLTESMCMALAAALDHVEGQWRDAWRKVFFDKNDTEKVNGHGALIIVADRKQQKFFSNGFDYPTLLKRPHFIPSKSWQAFSSQYLTAGLSFLPSYHGTSIGLPNPSYCGYQWTRIRCWLLNGHVLRLPYHEGIKGMALNE